MTTVQDVIGKIFAADESLDLEAFVALLARDAVMRVGAGPDVRGHPAIRSLVKGLFAAQRMGIKHHLIRTWPGRPVMAYQAEAAMALADGRDLVLPYVNVLTLDETGMITDYRVHIDMSPLSQSS